jgi:hypothetical protein
VCTKHIRDKKLIHNFYGNLPVDGRTILKRVSKKQNIGVQTGLIGFEIEIL